MSMTQYPATEAPIATGQTVFDRTPPAPAKRQSIARPILIGALALLPFALGVAATLAFTRNAEQPTMASPAETQRPPTLEELVALSESQQPVTRGNSADLLTPAHPLADVLEGLNADAAPVEAPQQAPGPVDPLAEIVDQQVAEIVEEEKAAEKALGLHMRMLREGVLADVYNVETREVNGVRHLMLRPVNVELSQRFMKTLLVTAEARGDITFPPGLSAEDGSIDLDTMIFNLVQNSLANDGTAEGARAARQMMNKAFQAAGVVQQEIKEEQTYTVEPGDSLAYISLKFYGQPGAYRKIFDANRAVLQTPDQIRVGQRLVIPG